MRRRRKDIAVGQSWGGGRSDVLLQTCYRERQLFAWPTQWSVLRVSFEGCVRCIVAVAISPGDAGFRYYLVVRCC